MDAAPTGQLASKMKKRKCVSGTYRMINHLIGGDYLNAAI